MLRTQRLGYSPKNACHLSSSTAKQQSPHENNENAFKGAKHPHAELRIYTCIGASMCNCTLPFVFWELILASILLSNMISFNAFHSNMPHPKCLGS